jgi:flagellin
MAMTINTNMASLNAQRQLSKTQSTLSTAMQRLSSGLRVNSAKDDAAGLAISVKMDAQIKGGTVAIRNANDGISLAQTAEGALSSVTDMMQRMRELAVEASNATNSDDLTELDSEYQALGSEIGRVMTSTEFNGVAVLAGGASSGLTFQIGANNATDNQITVTIDNLSTDTTVTDVTGGDLTSAANAQTAMTNIDTALDTINSARSTLGSAQNRFEYTVSNLEISNENTSSAKGRIVDADFATETSNLSKAQILQQAGTSMLAQANSQAQQVLTLLK